MTYVPTLEEFEALRAENRRLRDALYQYQYPPDPRLLREIADEIDCGRDCEHGHTEWDTNAFVCSREDRAALKEAEGRDGE